MLGGNWWLNCASGVWPCGVIRESPVGVIVRPTHPNSPSYGETIVVEPERVHDDNGATVREVLAQKHS